MEQDHGQRIVVAAMEGKQGGEAHVAEVVGVDEHDQISIVRKVGIGGDGTRRAQELRLVCLGQSDVSLGIDLADVAPDLLRQGMGVDPSRADARLYQSIDPEIQQGTTGDRYEALGNGTGDRTEACSQPPRQQEGYGFLLRVEHGSVPPRAGLRSEVIVDKDVPAALPSNLERQLAGSIHRLSNGPMPPRRGDQEEDNRICISYLMREEQLPIGREDSYCIRDSPLEQ